MHGTSNLGERRIRWSGLAVAVVGIGLGLFSGPATAAEGSRGQAPGVHGQATSAEFLGQSPSTDSRQVAAWIARTGDNQGLPFIIVDKKDARVFVFDDQARLRGATKALLGLARGDESAPGVGDRPLSQITPAERTTPAGRFVASLGRNIANEETLWVDYDTALALHRVRAANTPQGRIERLSAPSPLSRRITFGCINVPANFYEQVVRPAFTGTAGVVYILPEAKTLSEVFFGEAAAPGRRSELEPARSSGGSSVGSS